MAEAEIEARKEKLGLWKNANAIAPWIFRQLENKKPVPKPPASKSQITLNYLIEENIPHSYVYWMNHWVHFT